MKKASVVKIILWLIGFVCLFRQTALCGDFTVVESTYTMTVPRHSVGAIFHTETSTAPMHVAVLQDKNRDRLIGYFRGRESYARDIGANNGAPAPDYALQVQMSPAGCKERYKTYEDLPAHSVPCKAAGKDAWLIYYTDDFK